MLEMVAIAESTPGPIAINAATYVGYKRAGLLGSIFATLGVVLPSFIIILVISALFANLLKFAGVKWALKGVKAVVAGLITATGLTMLCSCLLGTKTIGSPISFDIKALIIFALVVLTAFLYNKFFKKKISPILLIVISAILGILLYAL
jgi:chromate transporter